MSMENCVFPQIWLTEIAYSYEKDSRIDKYVARPLDKSQLSKEEGSEEKPNFWVEP